MRSWVEEANPILRLGTQLEGRRKWLPPDSGIYAIRWEEMLGCPGDSVVKDPPVNTGDMGSIPGLERSLGEGNGNPL